MWTVNSRAVPWKLEIRIINRRPRGRRRRLQVKLSFLFFGFHTTLWYREMRTWCSSPTQPTTTQSMVFDWYWVSPKMNAHFRSVVSAASLFTILWWMPLSLWVSYWVRLNFRTLCKKQQQKKNSQIFVLKKQIWFDSPSWQCVLITTAHKIVVFVSWMNWPFNIEKRTR